MIYCISYPRSGNTAFRFIIELMTGKPTNGLCGEPNSKDNLQQPLIHKDSDSFVLHKRHDFKGVTDNDFVFFLIRHPLECTVRHNEKIRGISEKQMYGYIDSWFGLLLEFDHHQGYQGVGDFHNGIPIFYDELIKIASKESQLIYRHPQSGSDPLFHRAKLGKDLVRKLENYMQTEWEFLYSKYLDK